MLHLHNIEKVLLQRLRALKKIVHVHMWAPAQRAHWPGTSHGLEPGGAGQLKQRPDPQKDDANGQGLIHDSLDQRRDLLQTEERHVPLELA